MRKVALTDDLIIDLLSAETYEDMKENAPAWLEHLRVESPEDIARMLRNGTWTYPDYKRQTPPII